MKKSLLLIAVIGWIVVNMFSSCTKETIKDQVVFKYDTVRINTVTHDTVKYITGMDSVKADFVFTVSYPIADSMQEADLFAQTNSYNVPSDAVYTWTINDVKFYTVSNQSYCNGSFEYSQNGQYTLCMTITCPSTQKVYSVTKVFTIKLKG